MTNSYDSYSKEELVGLLGRKEQELSDMAQLPKILRRGSVKINSSIARTGFINVDETNYLQRRMRYFNRRRALGDLYTIAFNTASVRSAMINLRNEIFRRGYEWRPRFAVRCDACDWESEETSEACPHCANATRVPDHKQLKRVRQFFKKVNASGLNFITVCKQAEEDVHIVDDAFLLLSHTYEISDDTGEIKNARLDSIQRLDPLYTEFDLTKEGWPGRRSLICLRHREAPVVFTANGGDPVDIDSLVEHCAQPDTMKTSGICGCRLYPAMYRYTFRGKPKFFTEWEIIHYSRYDPSETYGFSLLFTIYEKCLTLIGMDRFLYDYFYDRQLPVGILTIVTDNAQSIEEKQQEWEARLAEDPHYIPILPVESQSGAGKAEWIKLGYTLEELQYNEIREDIRRSISSLFGVTLVWQNDVVSRGGVQTSRVQLVVQSRVISNAQEDYNDIVFPRIADRLGITDYALRLLAPEEQAEATQWDIKLKEVEYARVMRELGFRVRLTPQGEFIFSGEASNETGVQNRQTANSNEDTASAPSDFVDGPLHESPEESQARAQEALLNRGPGLPRYALAPRNGQRMEPPMGPE